MKSDLNHLPKDKQDEIFRILEIIKSVVDPEMVVLFGSYAKGTYVEHQYVSDGVKYEYISDYDFLVVTKDNPDKAAAQEGRIMDLVERFKPPVNLEIHDIAFINKGLEWGEYFWTDIVKEGVLLFDRGTVSFSEPRELSHLEKREKAQRYFNNWFPQANEFLIDSRNAWLRNSYNISDFYLHQAAESLYYTVLLVFTDFKPKTHNLWKLRRKAKQHSETLFHVFRVEDQKNDKRLFELLKQGYIDARYREDFSIDRDDLEQLIERVTVMSSIVESVCRTRIESLSGDL